MTRVAKPGVPDLKVEFAPTDDASTTSPTWVDITSYVRMSAGVSFERGRNDERATAQPGQMTLTLNNTSGRFTPGLTSKRITRSTSAVPFESPSNHRARAPTR